MDARAMIKSLGGPSALADALSRREPAKPISAEAVQKWCERGAIPPRWHYHLVTIAEEHGVPLGYDDLFAMGQGNGAAAA